MSKIKSPDSLEEGELVQLAADDHAYHLTKHSSIKKVTDWKCSGTAAANTLHLDDISQDMESSGAKPMFRGRTPSCEALKCAVTDLYRLDDFESEKLGAGFFSEVFKVRHKATGKVMVLKMNKHKANSMNMRKEIQLMNKLNHPNILQFKAVCVHEGQLHALTEYIDGGTLEELVQDLTIDISWSQRMEIGVHIAQGLHYLNSQGMFHRDLTSKNVFLRKQFNQIFAIIGDFGLATKIPKKTDPRLPQVGSPYWMSPECLRGEFYDKQADIFSLGIIMCELIARVDADPDFLPRTQNFGVEYKAFSDLCPSCPANFLKITFTCVSIDQNSRPSAANLVHELSPLIEQHKIIEDIEKNKGSNCGPASLITEVEELSYRKIALKRFLSEGTTVKKITPSEKARIHQRSLSDQTAKSVGEEMCLIDPYYQPPPQDLAFLNPFATLPRLRKGRKIIGSTSELFSSCFEVPSPRVASPICAPTSSHNSTISLPNSPTNPHRGITKDLPELSDFPNAAFCTPSSKMNLDYILDGEPALRKSYSSGGCLSQDDSGLGIWSGLSPAAFPIRRCGSCESGFYSSSNGDWISEGGMMSSRSMCSSLLTVSDLEEDLRAASAFLSNKRTSSVFSNSLDDLSSRLDEISSTGFTMRNNHFDKYEKDIRDIVEYFEKNCHINRKVPSRGERSTVDNRSSPEIARSQKIESLIKRVAENKSRARFNRRSNIPQQHLQVCDGIVRSKLPIFDQTKRQNRNRLPFDQHGFVKAKLAMFDQLHQKPKRKVVSNFLIQQKGSPRFSLSSKKPKESSELQNATRNAEKSVPSSSSTLPNTSKKF